ncbi:MAG: hypothetical protein CL846_01440 [Crocinitomicaceae bacterium]|nr:hypothetical protein [Crocinitomicaceae bacterium]|tara:strand:+ start:8687 stop:9547 length:861 start_codon:yes stop_codon:yes gene_type:complete
MVKFSTKIHKKRDLLKVFLGYLEHNFIKRNKIKNELLVLNYHGVPENFLNNFNWQINYLIKNFSIISPSNAFNIFNGQEPKHYQPKILITFDDGTKNILKAIEILDEKNIKSIIFIIPDFIDSIDQKKYYKKNIRPEINPNIENSDEDFSAISWDSLINLLKNNHHIGSHSLTHKMNNNNPKKVIENEIIKSKKVIQNKLNIDVESFCSINNSLLSINKYAIKKIKENYSFHFTTIAGNNIEKKPYSIKRINVEAFWTKYQFLFAIGKIENFRWKRKRKKIDFLMD